MKTIFFTIITFFVVSLQNADCQNNASTDSKNIATIRQAYEYLNQRNWAGFEALCDGENYTEVNVGMAPIKGAKNAIELYKQFMAGFPDFKLNILDIAPAGNGKYLLRMMLTGTHTGEFMGIPPTGKAVKWLDADVVTLNAQGKCTKHEITNAGEALVQIGHASLLNPSTQLVMQVYEKFGKGDIEGILAACNENVVFEIEDRNFDSKKRTYKGKKEVADFFGELAGKISYSKFQPVRFIADGEDVFIIVETNYEVLDSKKAYDSKYTHHFKIVNGKISYFNGLDGFATASTSMR